MPPVRKNWHPSVMWDTLITCNTEMRIVESATRHATNRTDIKKGVLVTMPIKFCGYSPYFKVKCSYRQLNIWDVSDRFFTFHVVTSPRSSLRRYNSPSYFHKSFYSITSCNGSVFLSKEWKWNRSDGLEASDGRVWWKKFEPGSVQDARRREFRRPKSNCRYGHLIRTRINVGMDNYGTNNVDL